MLSPDDARLLTQTGAGSLLGELLRRYWMPIAAEVELEEKPIRPVRVLGEDLVLYKDEGGALGLVDRRCPHRRADLAHGTVEATGIRCSYHGWHFDGQGRCLAQPFEEAVRPDSTFKERVRIAAHPVVAKAGLVWAYLGPEPAPLLPDWAGFHAQGYTVVALLHVPCNWLQIAENLYDPVHGEWLHDRWSYRLRGREVPRFRPRHTAIRWLDFEYGAVFQRKLAGSDRWLADRTVVFPNLDAAAGQGWALTWVVPVDDTHTLLAYRLTITNWRSPLGQVMIPPRGHAGQERIPAYRTSARLDPEQGPHPDLASHVVSQDCAAWLGPGPVADRTREHLGESDRGVIMFRKNLLEQARIVARGGDPQGVIRDPEKNRRITLPGGRRNYGLRGEGLPGLVGDDDPVLRAFLPFDLPQEIKEEVDKAMSALIEGLRPDWWKR